MITIFCRPIILSMGTSDTYLKAVNIANYLYSHPELDDEDPDDMEEVSNNTNNNLDCYELVQETLERCQDVLIKFQEYHIKNDEDIHKCRQKMNKMIYENFLECNLRGYDFIIEDMLCVHFKLIKNIKGNFIRKTIYCNDNTDNGYKKAILDSSNIVFKNMMKNKSFETQFHIDKNVYLFVTTYDIFYPNKPILLTNLM